MDILKFSGGSGGLLSARQMHAECGERRVMWTVEEVQEKRIERNGEVDEFFAIKFEEHPDSIKINKTRERVLLEAWGRDGDSYRGKRIELFVEPFRSANSNWTIAFRIPEQAQRETPDYPDGARFANQF